ncbi:hypothetical protein C3E98_038875, partial [Pseudomonas sp. MWU13-2625]
MKNTPHRQRKALSQATILALACLGSTAALAAGAPDLQDNSTTLPAVTVTGEKINRSLQDTTTAVTVLRDADKGEV